MSSTGASYVHHTAWVLPTDMCVPGVVWGGSRTQQSMLNMNCSHLREYAPSRRFYQQLKVRYAWSVVAE